ncbi:cyclic nucleotide-binding domain containing protein [Stylonychia lemnae]|uniref:Cyclic nucleotide-binding domain containing protein n=1 Tax=Stylonychia lemnae TaxID=5949 RepID=A0A077ZTJ4_STYLE|nr:cyclic nucleotide-binding domain containing protein [Stylonychia lemnae]|eukprot:CDW73238.1 cyclic nucleotide-binding domain containing protein [Stylonychia lemnae]
MEQPILIPYKMIKNILKKLPKDRTEDDIKSLEIYLSTNQFFEKLQQQCDKEALHEAMRALQIQCLRTNSIVFQFGDFGDEFFIILNGKVSVQVPTQINLVCNQRDLMSYLVENFDLMMWRKIENGENLKKSAEYEKLARQMKIQTESQPAVTVPKESSSRIVTDSSSKSFMDAPVQQTEKEIKLSSLQYNSMVYSEVIQQYSVWILKEVAQLGKGMSFGELALITAKPRAATIVCAEDTDLAVLDKNNYERVVGKALRRKVNEKVEFLQQFRILSHINETQVQRLTYYLKEVKFNRGHVVYKIGQKVDGIYFIKEGEFELIREINVHKQMESYIAKARQTDMTMGQKLVLKKQTKLKQDPSVNKIRVAILGKGEIFGIEETQVELGDARLNTVICYKNDSLAYYMSLQDFKERVVGDKVLQDIEVENSLKKLFYKFRKAQIKIFGEQERDRYGVSEPDYSHPPPVLKLKDYIQNQNQTNYQKIIKEHLKNKGSLHSSLNEEMIKNDENFMSKFRKHQNRLKPILKDRDIKTQSSLSPEISHREKYRDLKSKSVQKQTQIVDLSSINKSPIKPKFEQPAEENLKVDLEETKKLLNRVSSGSFFKVITETLKQDEKTNNIDNTKAVIRVIDSIKNQNEQIFIRRTKVYENGLDKLDHIVYQNLKGKKLQNKKGDKASLSTKFKQKSHFDKASHHVRGSVETDYKDIDEKTQETQQDIMDTTENTLSKSKLINVQSHKVLPENDESNKSAHNKGNIINHSSIEAIKDPNFSQAQLARLQEQQYQLPKIKVYQEKKFNLLQNQSNLNNTSMLNQDYGGVPVGASSQYYNNKSNLISEEKFLPINSYRELENNNHFLPSSVNYSFVQKMKRKSQSMHKKTSSLGSATQQQQEFTNQQAKIKALFQKYLQDNQSYVANSESQIFDQSSYVRQMKQRSNHRKANSKSAMSGKEELIQFRNQIITQFNNSQIRLSLKQKHH